MTGAGEEKCLGIEVIYMMKLEDVRRWLSHILEGTKEISFYSVLANVPYLFS